MNAIIGYKLKSGAMSDNDAFPMDDNVFHDHFEWVNKVLSRPVTPCPSPTGPFHCFLLAEVRSAFTRINRFKNHLPINMPRSSIPSTLSSTVYYPHFLQINPRNSSPRAKYQTTTSSFNINHNNVLQRLVMAHIGANLPGNIDPLQFSYKKNRSKKEVFFLALYSALDHLNNEVI